MEGSVPMKLPSDIRRQPSSLTLSNYICLRLRELTRAQLENAKD